LADDVCFSLDLIAALIEVYTAPGDLVFDPTPASAPHFVPPNKWDGGALGYDIDESRVAFACRDLRRPELDATRRRAPSRSGLTKPPGPYWAGG